MITLEEALKLASAPRLLEFERKQLIKFIINQEQRATNRFIICRGGNVREVKVRTNTGNREAAVRAR